MKCKGGETSPDSSQNEENAQSQKELTLPSGKQPKTVESCRGPTACTPKTATTQWYSYINDHLFPGRAHRLVSADSSHPDIHTCVVPDWDSGPPESLLQKSFLRRLRPSTCGSFHLGCPYYSHTFLWVLDWTGTAVRNCSCHNIPVYIWGPADPVTWPCRRLC